MKNRWDSNPWDTSALLLGPEKLCPHLPKKPSNNKLCTDISVGIAFGLVTPLVPKSVLKKKCTCINKLKNTFLNFLPNFFDVSKVKHNNVGIIIFNTDWHAYWATQGADEKNIVHLLFCGTGHLTAIHGLYLKRRYMYSTEYRNHFGKIIIVEIFKNSLSKKLICIYYFLWYITRFSLKSSEVHGT